MTKFLFILVVGCAVVFWFWQRNTSLFQLQDHGGATEKVGPPRDEVDPFLGVSSVVSLPRSPQEQLTFSRTMTLGSGYRTTASRETPLLSVFESQIQLPPFPANTSERTKKELALLHEYTKLRTPDRLRDIQEEREMSGVRIGPEVLTTYFSSPRYTATGKLLRLLFEEIEPVILRQKVAFDRVRPDKLDPTLTTAIDVPEHPAYPSGHATQSFAVAFLLGMINPERQSVYERDALRIAVNREIAGVHYPSDSAAGKILASQVVSFLIQHQSVAKLIEEARAEWSVTTP